MTDLKKCCNVLAVAAQQGARGPGPGQLGQPATDVRAGAPRPADPPRATAQFGSWGGGWLGWSTRTPVVEASPRTPAASASASSCLQLAHQLALAHRDAGRAWSLARTAALVGPQVDGDLTR